MQIQLAKVARVDDDKLWLDFSRPTHCQQCAQQGGCQSLSLASILNRRQPQMAIAGQFPDIKVGQTVQLAVSETQVLKATFMLYGLPILTFVLVACIAQWWLFRSPEWLHVLLSFLGLLSCFWLLKQQRWRWLDLNSLRVIGTASEQQPCIPIRTVE